MRTRAWAVEEAAQALLPAGHLRPALHGGREGRLTKIR